MLVPSNRTMLVSTFQEYSKISKFSNTTVISLEEEGKVKEGVSPIDWLSEEKR